MDAMNRRKGAPFHSEITIRTRENGSDRPDGKKTILEDLLVGVQKVTLTALYISCGAAMYAWEALGKFFQTLSVPGHRMPLSATRIEKKPTRARKPRKMAVPILPIDGYDRLETGQVMERLAGLSERALRLVRNYEASNRNRDEILRAIDRRLAGNN